MGEVGDQGPQFHAEAGAHARAAGIAQLFALGALSAHATAAFGDARHFDDIHALQLAVKQALPEVGSVLVKGSRFMAMERVVEAITASAAQPQARKADDQNNKQNDTLEGGDGATH